ncbi:hypothetical protein HYPSUDRAFT_901671 [Hypholoma sublateritium FD-334 SS-4]|uniref:Uncharacterized protein n=1 Tax=Hypholoma sublateritium (strain FD-334 SS-4) TaxID=945553 RepID=A0A0D2NK42_HYPSF|nr:hypothetical protein HYPSUDRAFT_901671 [Hypholoma sublateritium FD-334 SS-4]
MTTSYVLFLFHFTNNETRPIPYFSWLILISCITLYIHRQSSTSFSTCRILWNPIIVCVLRELVEKLGIELVEKLKWLAFSQSLRKVRSGRERRGRERSSGC